MHIERSDNINEDVVCTVIRYRAWATWFISACVLLSLLIGLWYLYQALGNHTFQWQWWYWVFFPGVLFGLFVGYLILAGLWIAWRGYCLQSNWLIKLTDDGMYVQLRSYLNFQSELESQALYLAFTDIEELAGTSWQRAHLDEHGDRLPYREKCIDLRIRGSATEAHQIINRYAQEKRSGLRIGHVPVRIPKSNVVRLEWMGRRALRTLLAAYERFARPEA